MTNPNNLTWHDVKLGQAQHRELNGHGACVVWFTGLSGSGKSTLANHLNVALYHMKVRSNVLDGDNLRHSLNSDLDFSPAARSENIRRAGEVAKLFVNAGLITITAFISPYRQDRERVRKLFAPADFIEVYLDCSLKSCRKRDPKGLYKRVDAGEIKEFTGVSAPYEVPLQPELIIDTDKLSEEQAVDKIIGLLKQLGKF